MATVRPTGFANAVRLGFDTQVSRQDLALEAAEGFSDGRKQAIEEQRAREKHNMDMRTREATAIAAEMQNAKNQKDLDQQSIKVDRAWEELTTNPALAADSQYQQLINGYVSLAVGPGEEGVTGINIGGRTYDRENMTDEELIAMDAAIDGLVSFRDGSKQLAQGFLSLNPDITTNHDAVQIANVINKGGMIVEDIQPNGTIKYKIQYTDANGKQVDFVGTESEIKEKLSDAKPGGDFNSLISSPEFLQTNFGKDASLRTLPSATAYFSQKFEDPGTLRSFRASIGDNPPVADNDPNTTADDEAANAYKTAMADGVIDANEAANLASLMLLMDNSPYAEQIDYNTTSDNLELEKTRVGIDNVNSSIAARNASSDLNRQRLENLKSGLKEDGSPVVKKGKETEAERKRRVLKNKIVNFSNSDLVDNSDGVYTFKFPDINSMETNSQGEYVATKEFDNVKVGGSTIRNIVWQVEDAPGRFTGDIATGLIVNTNNGPLTFDTFDGFMDWYYNGAGLDEPLQETTTTSDADPLAIL